MEWFECLSDLNAFRPHSYDKLATAAKCDCDALIPRLGSREFKICRTSRVLERGCTFDRGPFTFFFSFPILNLKVVHIFTSLRFEMFYLDS